MMKFKRGETVIEPSIGICKTIGMKRMKVDGQEMTVYIFEAQSANVYVPEDQVEKRGIRPPMTRDDVKKVLNKLKQPAAPNRADARLQYVNYREIMKSGDPMKIASLLRDLYILDMNDDLKGKEKEIMEQAKKFLCEEVSFVREQSKATVQETINDALRQMFKKKTQRDKERAKKTGVSPTILGYADDEAEETEEYEGEEAEEKEEAEEEGGFEEDEEFEEDEKD